MTKSMTDIISNITPFIKPLFIADIMVKTAILIFVSFYIGRFIDRLFPKPDENKKTRLIWLELFIQAGISSVIVFLYRTVLTQLSNNFDLLDSTMSNLSTKGASLFGAYIFFGMQKNIKTKFNILKKR